jgi:hypothetical protein
MYRWLGPIPHLLDIQYDELLITDDISSHHLKVASSMNHADSEEKQGPTRNHGGISSFSTLT